MIYHNWTNYVGKKVTMIQLYRDYEDFAKLEKTSADTIPERMINQFYDCFKIYNLEWSTNFFFDAETFCSDRIEELMMDYIDHRLML